MAWREADSSHWDTWAETPIPVQMWMNVGKSFLLASINWLYCAHRMDSDWIILNSILMAETHSQDHLATFTSWGIPFINLWFIDVDVPIAIILIYLYDAILKAHKHDKASSTSFRHGHIWSRTPEQWKPQEQHHTTCGINKSKLGHAGSQEKNDDVRLISFGYAACTFANGKLQWFLKRRIQILRPTPLSSQVLAGTALLRKRWASGHPQRIGSTLQDSKFQRRMGWNGRIEVPPVSPVLSLCQFWAIVLPLTQPWIHMIDQPRRGRLLKRCQCFTVSLLRSHARSHACTLYTPEKAGDKSQPLPRSWFHCISKVALRKQLWKSLNHIKPLQTWFAPFKCLGMSRDSD